MKNLLTPFCFSLGAILTGWAVVLFRKADPGSIAIMAFGTVMIFFSNILTLHQRRKNHLDNLKYRDRISKLLEEHESK